MREDIWLLVPEVERGGSEKKQILNRRAVKVEMAEKVDNGDTRMRKSSQATSRTTLVVGDSALFMYILTTRRSRET